MLDAEDYPSAFVKINKLKIELSSAEISKNKVKAEAKITIED
jgi:hypothetical protein